MKLHDFQYKILNGFDDSSISPEAWNNLLDKSSVDEIFLTWEWQKTWWDCYGRGKLLLISAMKNNDIIAIAPLFTDSGMIYFVGSGGSDYLDFIGDIKGKGILKNILLLAKNGAPNFCGFCFYHVPDHSATGEQLQHLAGSLNWECFDEGSQPSPFLDTHSHPAKAEESTEKKSLVRHENWFLKTAGINATHFSDADDILPHLKPFFHQHIVRWEKTPYPSLFNSETHQFFYKRLCESMSRTGHIRFSLISWGDKTIAYHFGFSYKKKFLWYKPSFDISLAKRSPGEVLIRHLLLQFIKERSKIFDFGLGAEAFKYRFATGSQVVRTWGVYPINY